MNPPVELHVVPVMRPLLLALLLAACAQRPPTASAPPPPPPDIQVPDYARRPFEPFGHTNAVAIALREWRAFGSLVDDNPPGVFPPPGIRPDQQPGLWQRVGDYWWGGQDYAAPESGWTARYDGYGNAYESDAPAWSAAFISYVMRSAGARRRFTYSPLHADYINAAARQEGALAAERPETYPPQQGDLICLGRGNARALRFEDLPGPRFLAHCDLVTAARPGLLDVVGGNVGASVTLKHVPTTQAGTLATADGTVLDRRWPWFVVLRVNYDAP